MTAMKRPSPYSSAKSANPPTAKEVDVIIQKRGGTGTRDQASPGPRRPHSPKREVQGVCW